MLRHIGDPRSLLSAKSCLRELSVPSGRLTLRPAPGEREPPLETTEGDCYQFVEVIGSGGMGQVLAVFDDDLRRHVAAKILPAEGTAGAARFVSEAQMMGQLQHPNILQVHDLLLTADGRPYYTMPLVRGTTLREALRRAAQPVPAAEHRLSLVRRIQVYLQVLLAVDYAHARGVIHRDLKPENIMLGEHGEVLLIDWGLARTSGFEAPAGPQAQVATGLAGTPGYMAPEQASGGTVDERADIYALGVILYELLTLEPPFAGSPEVVMALHIRQEPLPPSRRAPDQGVPHRLESACLRALSKNPNARHATARELHDQIQGWLEEDTERKRTRERAVGIAAAGRQKLDAYLGLKAELATAELAAEELGGRFKPWQPMEQKRALIEARKHALSVRRRLFEVSSEVVSTLTAALALDQECRAAREHLADYYWEQLQAAESRLESDQVAFFSGLVESYDQRRYARRLKGDGSLALESDPAEAAVWLHELSDDGFVSTPGPGRLLGRTPIRGVELPMGSYLVVLQLEGYPDVRYPVFITRNRAWAGRVRLTRTVPQTGLVLVPGGPFIAGGDPRSHDMSLERSEPLLEDFLIAVFPVTMEQYLEFVNDLALRDPQEAFGRAPRSEQGQDSFLVCSDAGTWRLPPTYRGFLFEPQHPAVGISRPDADAYCAWLSERSGFSYRLPDELEWEKAARGVDGRWFPWGNGFDHSLCNLEASHQEHVLCVNNSFPTDASVYGVRGLGGNVRDWTSTSVGGGEQMLRAIVRGGSFLDTELYSRCAVRYPIGPENVGLHCGFRLAVDRSRR